MVELAVRSMHTRIIFLLRARFAQNAIKRCTGNRLIIIWFAILAIMSSVGYAKTLAQHFIFYHSIHLDVDLKEVRPIDIHVLE